MAMLWCKASVGRVQATSRSLGLTHMRCWSRRRVKSAPVMRLLSGLVMVGDIDILRRRRVRKRLSLFLSKEQAMDHTTGLLIAILAIVTVSLFVRGGGGNVSAQIRSLDRKLGL